MVETLREICKSHKVCLCLFGHSRTFRQNAKRQKNFARNVNIPIVGHTWELSDGDKSWHGQNAFVRKHVTLQNLNSAYGDFANFIITAQNEKYNEVSYTNSRGNLGFVGHQYHMWQSILTARAQADKIGNFDYYIFMRYDLSCNFDALLHLEVQMQSWNSVGRIADYAGTKHHEMYDLFFVIDQKVLQLLACFSDFNGFKELLNSDYYLIDHLKANAIPVNIQIGLSNAVKIVRPRTSLVSRTISYFRKKI